MWCTVLWYFIISCIIVVLLYGILFTKIIKTARKVFFKCNKYGN